MKIKLFRTIGSIVLSVIMLGMIMPSSVYMHTEYVPIGGEFLPDDEMATVDRMLSTATFDDHIVFVINSPGGEVDILNRLREDVRTTKAGFITAYIPYYAYSCAAWLSMDADQVIMEPDSVIGFHYGSYGGITMSQATIASTDPLMSQYSKESLAALQEEPAWLFTQADWDLMNSGGITELKGRDFYTRMPWNWEASHWAHRMSPHLQAYLESSPGFVKFEIAVQTGLNDIQYFIGRYI